MNKICLTLAFAALSLLPGVANAQIITNIDADIPFQFVVGDTTLPAGKYIIEPRGEEEIAVVSNNGRTTVMHTCIRAVAHSEPDKTELIFRRYGNHEFLYKVFLGGESNGLELTQSKLEHELIKGGQKAVEHSREAKSRKSHKSHTSD
ncbi:MAG: hypothetical protein GC160_03850 [Acidobacteria bacterium]|nr:hypothetical protein [Acidobacteriota bacterium]